MKAAVLHEFKKPLAIEEVPRPQIASDEVLIKVEACGVCHSDLHVAEGDWKQFAGIVKKPLILGHEVAGRVAETGVGVRDLKPGDRVGVPWLYWSCGECEFCKEGNENLCVKQSITGVTVDGGFAEFLKVRATHATQIPENLPALEAAPLFCAGVTVHRALKKARISPSQRVAIFGVGGLGHLAIQLAHALGAEITAVDISESKLAAARTLGAARTLNASNNGYRQRISSQWRRPCSVRHLRFESRLRFRFRRSATHGNVAGSRPARRRHHFSADPNGRPRSPHPGFRCRHARRSPRSPGISRARKNPLRSSSSPPLANK